MKFALYPLFCIISVMLCSSRSDGQVITTYAGNGSLGYFGDGGPAVMAKLDSPSSIAMDGSGNLYINDQENSCIRKVTPAGMITTIAGTGVTGFFGDGGAATMAKLVLNWGVAVDVAGNVYITDQGNYRVRKVNTSGIINTIAGNGGTGTGGDGGPATAANFIRPIGIAVDNTGNVYVGDQDAHTIRKITPAGIITKVAGNGSFGYTGDNGPATNASLSNTWGLATDGAGNLYICDGNNNCIRRVNHSGIITTIVGNGMAGSGGDGGPATACSLDQPTGVFVDVNGNIYIADSHNNRVRKVNAAGIITTIAGTGVAGFFGDDGPATSARLYHPTSVAVDGNSSIFIADLDNIRIRKVNDNLKFNGGRNQDLVACENGSNEPINSLLSITELIPGVTLNWSVISPPVHGTAYATYSIVSTIGTIIPTGLYYTPASGYIGNDSFTVRISDGISADTTTIYVSVIPILPSAGVITGDSTVCVGSSVQLSESVAGGSWSISNLNAVVTAGLVTGQSAGLDTIRYTVTNGCGTASTSKEVTIYPLPNAGGITGASEFCLGAAIILKDTITGGVWSITNALATVLQVSPTEVLTTGIASGIDTVKYTVTDSVCSATVTHVVKINGFPYAGKITGPGEVCIGSQIILTDSMPGGIWTASNENAYLSPQAGTVQVNGALYGADTISYKVTNACGADSTSHIVNINLLPGKPTVTFKEGTLYAPAGYPYYQWTINSIIVPGANADTFNVSYFGIYRVTVTNIFGCSVSSDSINYEGCSPNDLNVFPNPATAIVHIAWCKKVTVKLLCADGKEVGIYEHADKIDISELPYAVYLMVFYDDNGNKIKTKRITKQRK